MYSVCFNLIITICQLMTLEKFLLCIPFSSNKFRDSQDLIKLWAKIHPSLGTVRL